ncbi:hypothetical protein BH23PSE1_BH23PSE1_13230 [soil metagenome]
MSRSAEPRRLLGDTRGAAALEFALIAGILIMLVVGVIEIGRALLARSDMGHALGQTVRIVHLDPTTSSEAIRESLAERLDNYAETELAVEVTRIADTNYMRIAVRFLFDISVPLLPPRRIFMNAEALAPMVSPSRMPPPG